MNAVLLLGSSVGHLRQETASISRRQESWAALTTNSCRTEVNIELLREYDLDMMTDGASLSRRSGQQ